MVGFPIKTYPDEELLVGMRDFCVGPESKYLAYVESTGSKGCGGQSMNQSHVKQDSGFRVRTPCTKTTYRDQGPRSPNCLCAI